MQGSMFEFGFTTIMETILLNDRNGVSKYNGNSLCYGFFQV